jgi:hypothetical protein
VNGHDRGQAEGEDGALGGCRRAAPVPERRDQLVYLFGQGADLLGHPRVATPLQRLPGPGPGIFDQRGGRAGRIMDHNGLPPARYGGADGTGVSELPSVRFGRSGGHRDEQAAAAFEPVGVRPRPDGEEVHVGFGPGVPAGVAADEDDGLGSFGRQPLGHLQGDGEDAVR